MGSEKEEKAGPKGRSGCGAFLGMVMSGILSLFIAGTMFGVNMLRDERAENNQRRALVHFLAGDAVGVYRETCECAYGVFVRNRDREMAGPLAGARSIQELIALDADPALPDTLGSIYRRQKQVEWGLEAAFSFYTAKKKLTQSQIGKAIEECTAMGEEVAEILKMAGEEGVDSSALAELEKVRAEAAKLADALVAKKEKLLPDVQLSTASIDFKTKTSYIGGMIRITNFSDAPVMITGTASSPEGAEFKFYEMDRQTKREPVMKPDESMRWSFSLKSARERPVGPFEGTVTLETDCPGYERFTIPYRGTVEHVQMMNRPSFTGFTLRDKRSVYAPAENHSARPLTVTRATCSVPGTKLTLREGNWAKPGDGVRIDVEFHADALPLGPFEGTFTVETDCPGHERITVPVAGVVKRLVPEPKEVAGVTVREDVTRSVRVTNGLDSPVTVRKATCSIEGVEVSLPKGDKMSLAEKDAQGRYSYSDLEVQLRFVKDAMAAGPFEGTLTLETDARYHKKVTIPVKGTVEK